MAAVIEFERDGYALADIALSSEQCDRLAESLPPANGAAGLRNLIFHPSVRALLSHQTLGEYLWSVIGRELVAVKATLFDKTGESNWRAQWHQDRSIAVQERREVRGYACWSTKAGVLHVEPPAIVLSQMVAVRIHLDDCQAENGPLRVLLGTHLSGKLNAVELANIVSVHRHVEVHARRGAFVLMRPLLVHASSRTVTPQHRRVLHIEFAPSDAISPLKWHTTVPLRHRAA